VAHAYWRIKGLEADLVILDDHPTGYLEEFHQKIQTLVQSSDAHHLVDKPGGIFVRRAAHLPAPELALLHAAARVVLDGKRGFLSSQMDHFERPAPLPGRLIQKPSTTSTDVGPARVPGNGVKPAKSNSLIFSNGFGGFTPDGREYVISPDVPRPGMPSSHLVTTSADHASTPVPWINVIANPVAGFLVSESGAGFTWVGNSQSNRLTPWNNDPVSDPPGEILYLRDEDTGIAWTPMRSGGRARMSELVCRHGQGYSVFSSRSSASLYHEATLFVPWEDPVKLIILTIRNEGAISRHLSATYYVEWVLGTHREQAPMGVIVEIDQPTGALLARNPFNSDFGGHVAFLDTSARPRTLTGDRTEFLGRNGSALSPAALGRIGLSGRAEPGLDPCGALQAPFRVRPGESKTMVFVLGQAPTLEEARELTKKYRDIGRARDALKAVSQKWDDLLTAVQVTTPDPTFDVLLNRWLLYQALGCRVWARSAFYQSGGAYGFRDQLQDVMALVYSVPAEARAHILRAAARQFQEGDVQHWWHPPAGRGIRTRFSDDFLWLPFVVCHYLQTTGDVSILDEVVPFLRGAPLKPEQEEDYGVPEVGPESGTVLEHCIRALEHGCRYGSHGLPLMGTGDWNDGMNRVGAQGKGESVWNAWFQIAIFRQFATVADSRRLADRAAWCRAQAERLRVATEEQAWDGQWYRRAYFDDGTPLGSAQNDECRIDSLVQTWAVIAGVADPERTRQAMSSAESHLVRYAERLILLFTPPFDKSKLQPGYIKGYVPGIRENGGQYTHAATWMVQAAALMGQGTKAVELFGLLNPIHHSSSADAAARYLVEPYVVVADVYSQPPHTGRGGWSWYTGSASWLYRVALENILGFHLRGRQLTLDPRVPGPWRQFGIDYRFHSTTYHITVENPDGVERGIQSVSVDGEDISSQVVELQDDGRKHKVRVRMGNP
jgi:cyclic beta-1,2-glucan synthetase